MCNTEKVLFRLLSLFNNLEWLQNQIAHDTGNFGTLFVRETIWCPKPGKQKTGKRNSEPNISLLFRGGKHRCTHLAPVFPAGPIPATIQIHDDCVSLSRYRPSSSEVPWWLVFKQYSNSNENAWFWFSIRIDFFFSTYVKKRWTSLPISPLCASGASANSQMARFTQVFPSNPNLHWRQ